MPKTALFIKGLKVRYGAIEAIKGIACQCPHGMTQEDVYELRAFLRWWKELKETVGGVVIKAIIWLIVGLAAVVALVTKPWSQ